MAYLRRKRWFSVALGAPLALLLGLHAGSVAAAGDGTPPVPLTPQQQAVHVLNRLGYGPAPGDVERVTQMGVARYIDSQLDPESIPLPATLSAQLAALPTVNQPAGVVLGAFLDARKQGKDDSDEAREKRRLVYRAITVEAEQARLLRAIDSPRQLQEVMVDFWYNHFNVFSGKGVDRALVASYERDAIRPYALGSFRDLLGATAKHPAMLYYLDNWVSRGDDVAARGKGGAKAGGLNENYGRELMELHTLGVDGGYSQHDVTDLARMLTGWTYDNRTLVADNMTFRFDPKRHDHGSKIWLGHTIAEAGQAEGEYALDVLAMHPATAHHISYQLAQYFVRDEPPPMLVERMASTWMRSHGDIRAVLRTLFVSPEFMAPENAGAKFKTPYQYVVSALRASGLPVTRFEPVIGALNQMGMPLYGCQTPDGYKNTQDAWLNPDALSKRIAFAAKLATSVPALDTAQLQSTLGGTIGDATLAVLAANPAKLRTGMLLGSPDFMQR